MTGEVLAIVHYGSKPGYYKRFSVPRINTLRKANNTLDAAARRMENSVERLHAYLHNR